MGRTLLCPCPEPTPSLDWHVQHRGQLQIHPKDSGAEGRTREELSNLTLEIPSQDEFRKCREISVLRASPAFISKSGVTGWSTSNLAEMTKACTHLSGARSSKPRPVCPLPTSYHITSPQSPVSNLSLFSQCAYEH